MGDFNQFVIVHKPQLESSAVPELYWRSLHRKLLTETFDAGESFQLMLIEYDDGLEHFDETRPVFSLAVAHEDGISTKDSNAIFLIDHAWTFRFNTARAQLLQHGQLTDRLCAITGVDLEDEHRVDRVLRKVWKYCNAYRLGSDALSDEERTPIWYIMDEVGSAVIHSNEPNFRLVPFLHLDTQTTYSLLFPIADSKYGEQATRDFVEYVDKYAKERPALLLPWCAADFSEYSFEQTEPDPVYFSEGHIPETFAQGALLKAPHIDRNNPLKVYSEYNMISTHLTAPEFEIVNDKECADILWLTEHFKDFNGLTIETPNKFINQFPFEYVITIKDLLCITGRRATLEKHHNNDTLETYPSWLPTTYNLKTELLEFAAYYQQRAKKGLDNHWIVKPWNLARGLDTHISNSLEHIVRLPVTGPKIAQKYIECPVLFHRAELDAQVKFDIRYVLLVKSVAPLEAYVHRKFFLRFANKPFALNHLDDYEQHFTVMNYRSEAELRHIKCEQFLELWQEQYPKHDWSTVERGICESLRQLLVCATERKPPCGIAHCPQSRAMYAADIMLEWDKSAQQEMKPKLLEVNWTPDCKRACDYYPEFFNEIFKLLFLDESNDEFVKL